MARCLTTLLDDRFVIGAKVFLKSLIRHNPWFEDDFVVIDLGLRARSKIELEKFYHKIKYVEVKRDKYKGVNFKVTDPRIRNTYYTLDVFTLNYDKIIFMDMDIVVLDDIQKLFNDYNGPFFAARAYSRAGDKLDNRINSGVFVSCLNDLPSDAYEHMIRISRPGHVLPDQTVINRYFKSMQYIDKIYNVEKRMAYTKNCKREWMMKRCLHYVGSKPWQSVKANSEEKKYLGVEKIWWKYEGLDNLAIR